MLPLIRPGLFAGSDGQVLFVQPAMVWDEFIELAFTEITEYGASSAQVVRRLLSSKETLAATADGLAGAFAAGFAGGSAGRCGGEWPAGGRS